MENMPVYDFEEAVQFILDRMLDTSRPRTERFPDEMIEEGCLCRRIVETVLQWEEEYMVEKGIIEPE